MLLSLFFFLETQVFFHRAKIREKAWTTLHAYLSVFFHRSSPNTSESFYHYCCKFGNENVMKVVFFCIKAMSFMWGEVCDMSWGVVERWVEERILGPHYRLSRDEYRTVIDFLLNTTLNMIVVIMLLVINPPQPHVLQIVYY